MNYSKKTTAKFLKMMSDLQNVYASMQVLDADNDYKGFTLEELAEFDLTYSYDNKIYENVINVLIKEGLIYSVGDNKYSIYRYE